MEVDEKSKHMKNIGMFRILLIFAYSFFLIACTNKKENQNESITSSCGNLDFVLPMPDVDLPNEHFSLLNYYKIDLIKMRSDTVNLTYPSRNIPSIDSLFSRIHNIESILKKDSLETEKWTSVCVKIPEMPLNAFLQFMCLVKNENNYKQWLLDLRSDEFIIPVCNKNINIFFPKDLDKIEYKNYLDEVDLTKLEYLNFHSSYRFNFVDYDTTNFQNNAEIIAKYNINNRTDFDRQLEGFGDIIKSFSEKYQSEQIQTDSICTRKGLQINFKSNINLVKILKIIELAKSENLVYDCFYNRNQLNIYSRCEKDRELSTPLY